MNSKLDTLDAVIYGAGLLLFIGLMASVICSVLTDKVTDTVTDTVTNEAVNNTTIVTETEVYKVVCIAEADTFCKEYSVRRVIKE